MEMVAAALVVASIFGDNMVLQQGVELPVWGQAAPGAKVTVKLGEQQASAVADAKGKWTVKLPAMKAGGPLEMTVSSGDKTVSFKNVMVGEVWLFSGQSNMQFGLSDAANAKEAIAGANFPEIRQTRGGAWTVCSPETASKFSAVAFFTARRLNKDLKVPIGIVQCALGGTPAEAWTSRASLEADPELKKAIIDPWEARIAEPNIKAAHDKATEKERHDAPLGPEFCCAPGAMFNYYLAPVVPYAIKGAVWYQGESDAWGFAAAQQYYKLLPALIRDWRKNWGQGAPSTGSGQDFPFIIISLPDWPGPQPARPPEPSPWQIVQDAQRQALKLPNTALPVTLDLGANDIHPKNKEPVGDRVALAAMGIAYGAKAEYSGPLYESMAVDGDKIRVKFAHVGGGLAAQGGGELKGFAIAGEDRYWVWAKTKIDGDAVIAWSEEVPKPVAVRYAMSEGTQFNLANKDGLLASPFKTDDWTMDIPVKDVLAASVVFQANPPLLGPPPGMGFDDPASKPANPRPPSRKPSPYIWGGAQPLKDFTVVHTYRKSANPTEVHLGYDAQNLYVQFRCVQDLAKVTEAATKPNDDKIWDDDFVELDLDTKLDKRNYFRIVVNPAGTRLLARGFNDAVDGETYKNLNTLAPHRGFQKDANIALWAELKKDKDAWIVGLSIPWKSLGMETPKPGQKMGLQLTRYVAAQKEESEWITSGRDRNTGAMMPWPKLYVSPMRFGVVTFE